MSQKDNEKRALAPRLRFPEFRREWASSPMSKVYFFKGNNSLSRDKLNYEVGSLRNIHYGDIHTKFAQHFRVDSESVPFINDGESHSAIRPENYCAPGDIVFADASEDVADIGKAIEIIDTGDVPLVSGLHTILAKPNGVSFALGFGAYLFSSDSVRTQIQREAQGAKVLGLSANRLGNVLLHYPSETDEQQKIADCLSSLDELIAAEIKRLDTLKAHRKGLMQQLFPREGETVPRLRFPEFQGDEGWKEYPVSAMLEEVLRPVKMDDDEDYTLVTVKRRYGGIVLREFLRGRNILVKSQFRIRKNDFLISKRQIVHCACGLVPEDYDGAIVSNEYTILKSRKNCDIGFFSYFSQQPIVSRSFLECSDGIVIEKMLFKPEQWLKKTFLFPGLQEQKKIAGCLSSLDELIAANDQNIETLKIHKNGLMRQLFPVPDEVQK
ncbi:hypothetical protein PEP31012_04333 [Pandoraea eparura]|uniref:Restriction endonuclease subunit S n=2 Tax=Pandoraea eparura TaxID=2508291 RepID=A0A5E4Y639_9BURK|nr:hypothetical protein PEP31012_04333 [Pandoraea eparura]